MECFTAAFFFKTSTLVGVAGGTAVVFVAEGVLGRQQPAGRAEHVTLAGAPPPKVPQKHILTYFPH